MSDKAGASPAIAAMAVVQPREAPRKSTELDVDYPLTGRTRLLGDSREYPRSTRQIEHQWEWLSCWRILATI